MPDKVWTYKDIPQDFFERELQELTAPNYGPREFGFEEFEGGVLVSCYIRMPDCTCDMYRWFMENYLMSTDEYKLSSSNHTYFAWEDKKKGESLIGKTACREVFGVRWKTLYRNPVEVFGKSDLNSANIKYLEYTVSEAVFDSPRTTVALSIGRDTRYGCEIKRRFFQFGSVVYNNPLYEGPMRDMKQAFEEISDLAEILPMLYWREHDMNQFELTAKAGGGIGIE